MRKLTHRLVRLRCSGVVDFSTREHARLCTYPRAFGLDMHDRFHTDLFVLTSSLEFYGSREC